MVCEIHNGKNMAIFPLDNIDETIANYPQIQNLLNQYNINYPGTYQILHLLGNEHYEGAKYLLKVIDGQIEKYGDCNFFKILFTEKDYFGFNRNLEEVRLLEILSGRFNNIEIGDNISDDSKKPDFIVSDGDNKIYFELYTPTDFYSFQFFHEFLRNELRYYPVEYGFDVLLEYDNSGKDFLPDFYYLYRFDDIYEGEKIIKNEIQNFLNNAIFKEKPGLNKKYIWNIGTEEKPLNIEFTFRQFAEERAVRRVEWIHGTKSSDTILFFERLEVLRNSRWYPLFKKKIRKSQCGSSEPNKTRTLLINFSHCDMGWKEDICIPRFHNSFQEIMSEINEFGKYYDVIQAVNLPIPIWGIPIVFKDNGIFTFPVTKVRGWG